jgi:diguanylate cyclase (GGDEF)-like protein
VRITTSHDPLVVPVQASPLVASTLIVAALIVVFALDRSTSSAPVQHLYYLPIIAAGLRFKMRGGVIAALAAIALYHVANPHLLTFRYGESDLVQIALFLAVGTITAKLTHDRQRLRQLATTDDLTGLHNLRSFEHRLAAMVRASRAAQTSLGLLVIDVDRLKSLNDEFGHLAGAEAVRTVGHLIGSRMPAEAVACRYGGDEFVIAIPRCTPFLVHRIADDLRRAVQETAPVLAGRRFPAGTLSISVGASCATLERHTALPFSASRDVEVGEALFRAADSALYRAKASGRNQVCVVE